MILIDYLCFDCRNFYRIWREDNESHKCPQRHIYEALLQTWPQWNESMQTNILDDYGFEDRIKLYSYQEFEYRLLNCVVLDTNSKMEQQGG